MLIKVFTIWVLASNISVLKPKTSERCFLQMNANDAYHMFTQDCDTVANEINKQIREGNESK